MADFVSHPRTAAVVCTQFRIRLGLWAWARGQSFYNHLYLSLLASTMIVYWMQSSSIF